MCNRRCARYMLCVLTVYAVLGYFLWPNLAHTVDHVYHYWDCSDDDLKMYLEHLVRILNAASSDSPKGR